MANQISCREIVVGDFFTQDGVEKRLPTRLSDAVNFEHFSVNKLSAVSCVNVNRVSLSGVFRFRDPPLTHPRHSCHNCLLAN